MLQTLTLHKQTLVWAFQFLPVQMLLDSKGKCLIDANDNNSSVLSHTSLWNHHIKHIQRFTTVAIFHFHRLCIWTALEFGNSSFTPVTYL